MTSLNGKMRGIWDLFLAWLEMKLTPVPEPKPEIPKPGNCECGHLRCTHFNGRGRCASQYPPDAENAEWRGCACQIFILDDDDDDSDDEPEPITPSTDELERMYKQ